MITTKSKEPTRSRDSTVSILTRGKSVFLYGWLRVTSRLLFVVIE